MSILDLRTIFLSHFATGLMGTVVMGMLWGQYRKRYAGLSFWLADFVLQLAAASLFGLRGQLPDWATTILSNTLVLLGAFLGLLGLERFVGKIGRQWHNYALLAVFVLVHSYFLVIRPNLTIRTLNVSAGLFILCVQCTWLMLRRVDPDLRRITRGVGIIFGAFSLVSLSHIPLLLAHPLGTNDFFRTGTLEALYLMAYQMLFILLAFGLALLVNGRLRLELQSQEEKYSKAFNSSSFAITLTRLSDGKLLETNQGFLDITGYQRSEVTGKSTLDLHLWDREEDRMMFVEELSQAGAIREKEIPMRKKSGELFLTLWSTEIMVIHGEPCLLSSAMDITQRKRAEEALRESEEKFSKTFHSSPAAMAISTLAEGRVLDANEEYLRSTGRSREELIGRTSLEIGLWEEPGMRAAIVADLHAFGRVHNRELPLLTKSGEIRSVLWSAEKVVIGGEPCMLSSAMDITERKWAEEALRESEARYRSILNASPDAIFITDAKEGRHQIVSPGAVRMYGYTREEELLGRLITDFIAPGDRDRAMSNVTRILQDNPAGPVEYCALRADGTTFDIETNTDLIRDPQGHPIQLVAIVREITERKLAEADNKKLEAQNQQLQKAESLGRMAGAIAHHFNNQLQTVMMSLEMSIEDLPITGGSSEFLSSAMHAARKAAEVSSLMLTYLGQTPANCVPLDLSELCLRSLSLLRDSLPKGMVLETALASPGPAILANANQLQQVLLNLITNAWEASPEGAGIIRLDVKTIPRTDIPQRHCFPMDSPLQAMAYACVEVADAGGGIEAQDIGKIFDPFFSHKFTGRGLGLPVVLGIVKAHGGAISVESKPGRGSVFRVFLPMVQEAMTREPSLVVKPAPMPADLTVLVVEDEPDVRKSVARALRRSGYNVLEAEDGLVAVALFQQHRARIRCVLCDVTMPRMNGWETLSALRKLAPDLPVILASGYSEAQVMEGNHPELPQAFLNKPYELKTLGIALAKVMSAGIQR